MRSKKQLAGTDDLKEVAKNFINELCSSFNKYGTNQNNEGMLQRNEAVDSMISVLWKVKGITYKIKLTIEVNIC